MNELPPQGERRESPRQLLDRMRRVLQGISASEEDLQNHKGITRRQALGRVAGGVGGLTLVGGAIMIGKEIVEEQER